jgi:hypothetical protein
MKETKGTKKEELAKLSIPEIKKSLKTYDKDVLVSMIIDCYKISSDVKNYIHVLLSPEEAVEDLYNKSKHTILYEFFPQRGFGKLRLSQAKKAITEFKSYSNDEVKTIDLMIYYVELGVDFTNTYGDINDSFYSSMESMYGNVLKKINNNDSLLRLYKSRLKEIVYKTRGIGWGFHDCLAELYYTYVSDDEEEEKI